jgi:hypothetical protein
MFQITLDGAELSPLDLTPFLKKLHIRIGIQDAWRQVAAPSLCRLTLHNEDRRFSPAYSGSPYFGLLLPNRRVTVSIDGETVFVGVLREVTVSSGRLADREAYFACEDLLSTLQATNIALPIQENKRADELIHLIAARAFRTGVARGSIAYKLSDVTQVSENDTVTINGVTYRFKATPAQANDVLRAAPNDRTGQMDFLCAAINGGQGEGLKYFAGTQRPPGVTALIKPSTLVNYLLARNPVRYYRFDEGSGTLVFDRGENKRDGVYGGSPTLGVTQSPTYAEDPRTAATFDGVDDVAAIPSLDLSNRSFAMHIMINASAVSPPSQQTIISTWDGSNIFNVRLFSTGQLQVVNGGITATSATGALSFGVWQRIVITYDFYSKDMKVWKDETVIATANGTGLSATNTVFDIGRAVFLAEYFKGSLAEFALWTRSDIEGFFFDSPTPPGLWLNADAAGAWANGIVVSTTSAALTASNLTGGANVSALSAEQGIETFPLAGDQWKAGSTNALTAIEQVVQSERGMFWQAKDGTLIFKNRDYWNARTIATPVLTLNSEHNESSASYGMADIFNRVVVNYTPRSELAFGVVARARQTIRAAGRWGTGNRPPELPLGGRFNSTEGLPPNGTTLAKIPFVDIDRGRIVGAKDLKLPPEPNVDFTAAEREDGYGADTYTTFAGLKFGVARTGSDIEVSIENQALGTLFIIDFQLRGTGIVAYDPVQFVREDETSIHTYGVRTLSIDLPLGGSQRYAEALAEYLLGRYKQPSYRVYTVAFIDQQQVDNVMLVALEIGDVISISDYQAGLSDRKHLVTGLEYSLSAEKRLEMRLSVRPLQDVTFWILGDATYGVLGSTTRLGV